MTNLRIIPRAIACLPFVCAIGCAQTDTSAPTDPEPVATEPVAANPSAIEVLLAEGGDYHFAFEESDVYETAKAKCDTGENAKQCMDELIASAAGEGVEIRPIDGHRVRYVSYSTDDDGRRRTLLEAEVTLKETEANIFELTDGTIIVPAGASPTPGQSFFIEVVDERTIAMDKVPGEHPRKGDARLVFHTQR